VSVKRGADRPGASTS
ncbi:hypothetical protein KIPB_010814, partial [Kipferlia bialata]